MGDLPNRTNPDFYAYSDNVADPFPRSVSMFDDFLGDVVADEWNFTEGTDSATSDGLILASVNGVFRLTPGDSAGTVAADGAQLNSELNWKASQGGLFMEARVQLAAITSVSCFIGFTDTKSLEQPIHSASSVNTITTNATDGVGVFFDTNMTDDRWWFAGVANDVDAVHQDSGFAPVAATWETFRIVVDVNGTATLYRATAADPANFMRVGTPMAGAVRPTIALTPCIIVRPLSAAANKHLDVDYVRVAANRA